jgi:hypothetical protein
LATSRRTADLPAFNQKVIEKFGEGLRSQSGLQAIAE